jgi:hypothetical protein
MGGDDTFYQPIEFRIVSTSDPSVTVANADNAGRGTASSPANFYYRQTLLAGQVSAARHLSFNNPNLALFTFDAVVTARVIVSPSQATRFQPEPSFDANFDFSKFTETFSGILPAADTGLQLVPGVTYADITFTSKDGAYAVNGAMTSQLTGVDMDLYLLDSKGNTISSSTSGTPNENVTAAIQPNSRYTYRVVGWAGAAQDYKIVSTQSIKTPKATSGSATNTTTTAGGTSLNTSTVTSLVRFTVNPLTKTVSVQVLR